MKSKNSDVKLQTRLVSMIAEHANEEAQEGDEFAPPSTSSVVAQWAQSWSRRVQNEAAALVATPGLPCRSASRVSGTK